MTHSQYIFGFHAITSRLRQHPDSIKEIYLDTNRHDQRARDLMSLAETTSTRLILCEQDRLCKMTGTTRHQGVAAHVTKLRRYATLEDLLEGLTEPALLLVLDGVKDPHNLGACLRVADAFGVHAVVVPKDRAVGLSATVHKVASGAVDTVPFFAVTNLARTLRELKEMGLWIVGTAADAPDTLDSVTLTRPLAWVLGAEDGGMRRLTREACDLLVSIPMSGSIESLNVSVSAGICLFETFRQHSQRTGSGLNVPAPKNAV
ncbi:MULTISPECIES: 23S rRNA (guanosine(2251)-2'-O)-methyltransferase RlmB [Nitrosomonas]|uniref:23S rRNA (guanosine-2'-O-)-methyltransferase RlmB n=1 Tax=Nitrosomonas europaea (strain ATCC 19718 / CIP 103999 / KCTC 2705 / NBRC 14298) TaxID=228410 RepID=RLMB_NITEU|nr:MULTISPECIES: 23S rRNA (guanosine(2251)-2'-O)-methyltransferase RlmB [Nitrosomonas]Q82XD1.1 RecName: Full=23S rRNA (guanosine-2'-O-)-methyltransferase RlmB; AltName: Full=23S rRNA (guanosine2251 2'-O)-methyltransferase; AltName: Full=23S rRNA Gm2251 2'-O-methyltransferase [Nitrosomonas europaea ATCC 19718]KXK40956.1 MAG: tRNA/rRNA methyltransferase [Nitrosomonas europaea]CAD84262.1 putative tRNA/rRNA methyltransferase [Nitrosomonas europaea ATCC 19718]SDW34782.1 23S rRNA Gm-2251 2'-O-methylt